MTNPNPGKITDPLWSLWIVVKSKIPGVRLGGIYADNTGYHNTRNRLLHIFPSSYSIRLTKDKQGPSDKAAGLDLTMSDAEMRKRTGYLRRSALHPDDDRLFGMREFIGTLDSAKVYCRIAGNEGIGQGHGYTDWTRDKSHLWHIHISILRAYLNNVLVMEGIASVLSGETWEQWNARKGEDDMTKDEVKAAVLEALNTTTSYQASGPRKRLTEAGWANLSLRAAVDYCMEHAVSGDKVALLARMDEHAAAEAARDATLVDQLRAAMSEEMGAEAGEAAARVLSEIIAKGSQPAPDIAPEGEQT